MSHSAMGHHIDSTLDPALATSSGAPRPAATGVRGLANIRTVIMLCALAAGAGVWIATPHGIGISPDSIAYLGAARNLAHGRGVSLPYGQLTDSPLTHFPPLYSMVLAAGGRVGMDPQMGARGLQALTYSLCLVLAGLLLYHETQRASTPALAGTLLLLTSPLMWNLALMAWTEMLFLALSVAGMWSMIRFLKEPRGIWLCLAAALVALAALTRFAGIALILSGGLAILFLLPAAFMRRVQIAALFGLSSALPLALWMLRNWIIGGSASGREIVFHPIGRVHAVQALDTVAGWLTIAPTAPGIAKLSVIIAAGLFIALGLTGLLRGQGRRQSAPPDLARPKTNQSDVAYVLLLFAGIYSLFLALSISFVDANTPLDDRILAPLYITGVLLILLAAHRVTLRLGDFRLPQFMLSLVFLFVLAHYTLDARAELFDSYHNGLGFSHVSWRTSETAAAIQTMPPDTMLVSNAPDVVYILTGRRALGIPTSFMPMTQRDNPNFAIEINALHELLSNTGGVVVFFHTLGRASAAQSQMLETQWALEETSRADHAILYRVDHGDASRR